MSYDSTVLADTPLAYWRCEELTGATALADDSGNDLDATIDAAAILGIAGPIETDAGSHGISNRVGKRLTSSGSTLDLRDAQTWEVWGRVDDLINSHTLLSRNGIPSLTGSNLLYFNLGSLHARMAHASGENWQLSYSSIVAGAWYHAVVTRNAGVMRLYVNGVLRGERTDLPTGSIVYSEYNSAQWSIGYSKGGGAEAFYSEGLSRVALYGTALSATRVLAHYEAAKASLPLRATILVSFSFELNTDQIVPTNLGFQHNYSQTFGDGQVPIIEELEYQTNINQSEPDYQQRVSARPHGPLRTLEYHFSPTAGAARARLQGHLYTPAQLYCVPVWPDSGVLTAEATSGTNTLSLDTTKRDFEIGSYVGICSDLQNPQSYQFFKITARTDTQLTLGPNIATTVANGSPVFPARVTSLSDDHFAVKSFAADHEDAHIRFEVIESELSTRRITSYTPSTTYLSTEVFTLETAKVPFLDDRPYDITRRIQSRGRDYQYAVDTGSPQTFPVRFLLTTRAALSEFYGWLDVRQGKLNPLFVSSKEKDYVATARPTASTLTVQKAGFSLHHGRRHLEILKSDGTFSRLRLTAITDNLDGTETLTTSGTFPAFADIVRVSFLRYCTLASDTVRIEYFKGGSNGAVIAQCGLSFRELLTSPA